MRSAEERLPLCNDPKVDQYLTNLGMKLVSKLDARRDVSVGISLRER